MAKTPSGLKIALACEALILVLMVASFFLLKGELDSMASAGARLGLAVQDSAAYLTVGMLAYALLFAGLLHILPAYLLWKRMKLAKYAVVFFAVLDAFVALISIPFSLVILYFVWFDDKTKGVFR